MSDFLNDFKLHGRVTLRHYDQWDARGNLLEEDRFPNVICNVGKAAVAGLILSDITSAAAPPFDWIALGTNATAASATDTVLGAEITSDGGERSSASGSRVTTSVTSDTAQLVNTFNFTGTLAIKESGMFNDANSGDMLARQVFSTKNVGNGDSLQVTWKIAVS
jgi:hypothetical protein